MVPAVGSIRRFRQRTRVDLPLPDRPMTTKVSPRSMSSETSCSPTVWPVCSRISSLVLSFCSSGRMVSGSGPNTLLRLRISMNAISDCLFRGVQAAAVAGGHAVHDDRQDHDGEARLEP